MSAGAVQKIHHVHGGAVRERPGTVWVLPMADEEEAREWDRILAEKAAVRRR